MILMDQNQSCICFCSIKHSLRKAAFTEHAKDNIVFRIGLANFSCTLYLFSRQNKQTHLPPKSKMMEEVGQQLFKKEFPFSWKTLSYAFLSNVDPQFGQWISTFPLPFGTRTIWAQSGQRK